MINKFLKLSLFVVALFIFGCTSSDDEPEIQGFDQNENIHIEGTQEFRDALMESFDSNGALNKINGDEKNNSNENSDVIEFHQTLDFDYEINCNPDPKIKFEGTLHIIYIRSPNGLYTRHYNANMEGVDENGGIWNWNEAWIFNYKSGQLNHDTRNVIIVGAKGAKLRLTFRLVRNGQGEIVRAEFEGGCP